MSIADKTNASGNKRVLVVDDSALASRQLADVIGKCDGFEVVGRAKNGAEALALLDGLAPDIVCLDIVMPVMDGLQALRTIQAIRPAIKVLMVSSVAGVGDQMSEALRLGAHDVIVKPFDNAKVEAILKRL